MQSDAFPTPSIYSHQFQPRLALHYSEQHQEHALNQSYLLKEIASLLTDCSSEQSQFFWLAVDRQKAKHRV